MRVRIVQLLVVAFAVASCGPAVETLSPSTSTAPSASTAVSGSSSPSSSQGASTQPSTGPSATPAPPLAGRWEAAGSMSLGRTMPRAVLLGDGSVLVVGNDAQGVVRPDSARSEIWDPADGRWLAGPSLDKPRAEFVALALADGRAFVTGGLSAGVSDSDGNQDRHQSFSSSFVFDTRKAAAGWSRVALQDHARTAPSAAALPDGRVLVAGGYYLSGASGLGAPRVEVAAVYRPGSCAPATCPAPPADVAPPTLVPALATAELYDPAKNSWSATGSLRYARVGAPAATLTDGRVLVVGSALATDVWNYTQPKVSDRAYSTAELFEPRTGRFSLTGDLPAVDWSPLTKLGPYPVTAEGVTSVGTLVALADGGALLVGQVTSWSIRALELAGSTVRTLRLDPGTGRWTQVDQSVYASVLSDQPTPTQEIVGGHVQVGAAAARMGDGRVLVAGGTGISVTDSAGLYDPATNTWSALAPLPTPRADSTALLLADGSVLIVGGRGADQLCDDCTGITGAVRFIPGR